VISSDGDQRVNDLIKFKMFTQGHISNKGQCPIFTYVLLKISAELSE